MSAPCGVPESSADAPSWRVGVLAHRARDARRVVDVLARGGVTGVVLESTGAGGPLEGERALDAVVVLSGAIAPERVVGWVEDRVPAAPVVLVSPSDDRSLVWAALRGGVQGYVVERDLERRLGPTVRAVAVGQTVFPAEGNLGLVRAALSPREKQVLSMVVLGFTNIDIANKLFITEATVKSHLSSAYRKLGVRTRSEATALILSDSGLGLGILTLAGDRGQRTVASGAG